MLHTKYISCGPHSFREEDFSRFFQLLSFVSSGPRGFKEKDFFNVLSYIVLYKYMTPWGLASLEPRGLISRIMLRTTKHCYTLNIQAVGLNVSEKKIFKVFFFPL